MTDPPDTRRELLAATGALLASSLAGCLGSDAPTDGDPGGNGSGNPPDSDVNIDTDADETTLEALVASNTAFAFDLHGQLVEDEPDENLFFSPYSISAALAMAWAGARSETATEMADALRFELDGDELHPAFGALRAELAARGEEGEDGEPDEEEEEGIPFQLTDANALWGLAEYPYREEFLDLLETNYGAGMGFVDFVGDPEGSRERINDWVAEQTEEKIEELLPQGSIDDLTRLVLTNAIYFAANWEHTFNENLTEDREFTALDGTTTDVPTMRQEKSFPYATVDGHELVELPYEGGDVSMLVILPTEGEFEAFESSIDGSRLDELVDELERREGTVQLPRFEIESGFGLKEQLQALGMQEAFDEQEADLSGMADLAETGETLYVDDAYHDAFVAVDEEGTEAAAATGVVVGAESAPLDPFEMVVDRPFLFAIRDRPTDSVLFLGRVVTAPEQPD